MGQLAARSYINSGDLGGLAPFLAPGGPQELLDRAASVGTLSDIRTQGLQRAQATAAVAAVLQRHAALAKAQQLAAAQAAKTAQAAAQTAVNAAAAQARAIRQRQDAMLVELATLQQTSLTLQQQHQAALQAAGQQRIKAAALQAAALKAAASKAAAPAASALKGAAPAAAATTAPTAPTAPAATGIPPGPGQPADSAKVAAVIGYARAQLGKWYLWGGAGPDRFDCSGLTMRAWQQAGVNLGHYTGFQYAQTTRVSLADRRPGDLIFYGPTVAGIHHVGLYIGGDTMIEAAHTGTRIRYASIWRSDMIPTLGRP